MPPDFSISSDDISFSSDVTDAVHQMLSSHQRYRYTPSDDTTRSSLDDLEVSVEDGSIVVNRSESLDNGSPMDEKSEVWWLKEAATLTNYETVAQAYAGEEYQDRNGFDGVKCLALDRASSEVGQLIESGDSHIGAFNRVTNDWPHEGRAWLARYEAEHADRDDGEYVRKTEEYAEGAGVMDEDLGQTELDCFYGDNPFDELDSEEARTVLHLRAHDCEITDDVLDQIADHYQFRHDLDDVGDVTTALQINEYDGSVPRPLLQEALPPDEWESDPTSILSRGCNNCGTSYHLIETEDGERWLSTEVGTGNPNGGAVVLDEDERYIGVHHSFLCFPCYNDYQSSGDVVTAVFPEHDEVVGFRSTRAFIEFDEEPPDLPREDEDKMLEVGDYGTPLPDSFFVIEPNSDLGDTARQESAINEVASNAEVLENGPVFINEEGPAHVIVEKTNFEAAQEVKERIESHV